jgi:hypothetical protein
MIAKISIVTAKAKSAVSHCMAISSQKSQRTKAELFFSCAEDYAHPRANQQRSLPSGTRAALNCCLLATGARSFYALS